MYRILIDGALRCWLLSLFGLYRVEDHDDIMRIFEEQTKLQSVDRPYFLAELIEAQNEANHAAVCEVCSNVSPFPHLNTQN